MSVPIFNINYNDNLQHYTYTADTILPKGPQSVEPKYSRTTNNVNNLNDSPIEKLKIDFNKSTENCKDEAILNIFNNFLKSNLKQKFTKITKDKTGQKLVLESFNKINNVEKVYNTNRKITSKEAYNADVYYEILNKLLGVSEEALNLVIAINGEFIETYNNVLFAITNKRDLSQTDII